jgi:hypothetical protein
MHNPVMDLGSNLEENLQRWSNALKGGGSKLAVWNVIYSGKRKQWTAKEISAELNGKITPKRVTEAGKRLLGDVLIRQATGRYPIVYEKIDDVHHYKARILRLALNKTKRNALPTKRTQGRVTVNINNKRHHQGRATEVTIDDVDQFKKVLKRNGIVKSLPPLPESTFKRGLKRLFADSGKHQDWGGEKTDFYTNKLRMKNKRYSAAFTLKGPGVGVRTVTPGKWGKQGNQIQRLLEAPARVFFLQFEGQIDQYSIDQLQKLTDLRAQLTDLRARHEGQHLYWGYIERDDSLRLRHAYPAAFGRGKWKGGHRA